ncbi:hypothetical protein PHLCEN_2v4466 [Hermanssonia centrifuga]|uniref:Uncharacterized protein n=1 Tax=Hermanssonia centrifuga TaxID=98765 RepID=A0A2R6PNH6_9APHY|nr:hypothetical protein PHLCEN_2v4466 [Hermanssonia centrifuga]
MGRRKWHDAEWMFLWEAYTDESTRVALAENDQKAIYESGQSKKGRAKDHHDGGMKKAAKLIYDKFLIQFPNARVEESDKEFKTRRQQMESVYRRLHFRAQRGLGETQEQFEKRKGTKLFEAGVAIVPVIYTTINL